MNVYFFMHKSGVISTKVGAHMTYYVEKKFFQSMLYLHSRNRNEKQ